MIIDGEYSIQLTTIQPILGRRWLRNSQRPNGEDEYMIDLNQSHNSSYTVVAHWTGTMHF